MDSRFRGNDKKGEVLGLETKDSEEICRLPEGEDWPRADGPVPPVLPRDSISCQYLPNGPEPEECLLGQGRGVGGST